MKIQKVLSVCGMGLLSALLLVVGCSSPTGSSSSSSNGSSSTSTTPSVTVAAQSGSLYGGTAGTATFAVTTANITATTGTVTWYTTAAGTTAGTAPTGISIGTITLASNAATVTATATTSVVAGSYYFTVTFGSTVSSVVTLTVTTPVTYLAISLTSVSASDTAAVAPEVDFSYTPTSGGTGVTSISVTYGLDATTYADLGDYYIDGLYGTGYTWEGNGYYNPASAAKTWTTVTYTYTTAANDYVAFALYAPSTTENFTAGMVYLKSATIVDNGVTTTYGFTSSSDNPFTVASAKTTNGLTVNSSTYVTGAYPF